MVDYKKQAAQEALSLVSSSMVLGLGSGSTAAIFIDLLGEAYLSGSLQNIKGVPTSEASATQARRWGIPLASLSDQDYIDLAVDGADEVDPQLNLIKGLGKALLREKMVEVYARHFVVIVDETKLVPCLGMRGPLPIEILPYEWGSSIRWLSSLGCKTELWRLEDSQPVVTDNGNYLARCWFLDEAGTRLRGILDPFDLARKLSERPGIVEHGLFLNMANQVIVAGKDGIKILERDS